MINKVHHRNGLNPELVFLQRLGKELYKHGYFIAGGSIWCAYRGLPINDIDVFSLGTLTKTPMELSKILEESVKGIKCSYVGRSNALTKFTSTIKCSIDDIPRKVQFVNPSKDRAGSPEDVISNFDLVNCACYISETGEIRLHSRYNRWPSTLHIVLASNVFVLGKVTSVSHTLKRVMKYVDRGMSLGTLAHTELLTIQKALFLEQLLSEDFNEYLDAYDGVTEDSKGFTFTEAQEYLRNNVQDYVRPIATHNMANFPSATSAPIFGTRGASNW